MKLPQIALRNSQFIFILVGLVLFVGFRSFTAMPKSEDPSLDLPNYTIIVIYPGTGPLDMEELIVDPIEEVIDELDDITEIRTEIANGLAIIQVEAEFGIDYDDKYDEIVAEVNAIRGRLPENIFDLEINQFKPEDRVVIQQYAIVSETAPYEILYDIAEDFQDELDALSFIKKTEIEAHPREEIKVSVDFQKMAQLGISLSEVLATLQGNNANIPGGDVDAGDLSFNIVSTGGFENPEEIGNAAIRSTNDQIVYLKNIATVTKGYDDQEWIARFNGKRCIYLSVNQKRKSNILALDQQMARVKEAFESRLPADVAIETAFEQAPDVRLRINDFINNLIQGIVLVGVVILIFLGWRPAVIVMVIIPLSIILAITVLDFTNYALQQISIAALVIALGLLVDNAIVVIENIIRLRKEGLSLLDAAAKGTGEVGYAIISSTVTTILAFAPLSLLESGPGEFLRSLPLTVIFALSASLILALILTPIVSSKILRKTKTNNSTWITRKMDHFIENYYKRTIQFALKKGWVIMVAGLVLLAGSGALFPSVGVSFFPTADKPLLLVSIDLPYTANVQRTDKAVAYVESVLDTTAFVESYITNAGHGNPQIYYNRIPEEYKKYHGEVVVNFKEWDPERFYATLSQLRAAFRAYPDGRIYFRELKNGAPFEAPIEILALGENLDTLKRIARDIEQAIAETPGTLDIDNPLALAKSDLKVKINRDKASLYQLPLLAVDQTVRASLNGIQVDEVTMEDDESYPLVVRIQYSEKPVLEDLQRIYFSSQTGHQVPLFQVADLTFQPEYAKISHFNLKRSIGVTANVNDPDATAQITAQIIPFLENYDWPPGYGYFIGGEYETQNESFGDLGTLLIIAMLGIFAVLVLQFRSFTQPLIIFSAIPLSITGSILALFITGWSFSFFAFVGFISLVGIVVNNSIILVDYTNQLMREGMTKTAAILRASERRFTPIVLTTLTTILGLLPLTVSGSNLWSPLGWTLIGGLISSMLLTLVVVPVLYNWFTKAPAHQNEP